MGTKLRIPAWIPKTDIESVKAFRRGYKLGLSGRRFPVRARNLVPLYAGWKIGRAQRDAKAARNNRRRKASKAKR
jgi:hypothetical protein